MKMTLEIDSETLTRVMALTGIRTKTEAVDFALRSAERLARKKRLMESLLSSRDLAHAIDSGYDLSALRAREMPHARRPHRNARH